MKRLIFALGVLFVFSCTKTENPTTTQPPVTVQEDPIKFTTNLDTGTYNVADTLPLVISVSSKLPSSGLLYSITATWTDSAKQIYKLDSSINQASLALNIPGFKKSGNYSLSVIVTSKSTSSNSSNKTIALVNNPLARFTGYKVDQAALAISRQKDFGKSYWENYPLLLDFMVYKFLTPPSGRDHIGNSANVVCGDFNNDGFVDIFCPGASFSGINTENTTFLIWNPNTKVFDNKNLFNEKSINLASTNPPKVVPVYLNNDSYVDLVIYGYVDEGINCDPPHQIMIAISDGVGGYNILKLNTETPLFFHNGGDIGDLNGDGIPDLVINEGCLMKILWGTNNAPYFDEKNSATFSLPICNLCGGAQVVYGNNNGFGESCINCVSDYIAFSKIFDINKDGQNDIFMGGRDTSSDPPRILVNQGRGRFINSGITYLPFPGPINQREYLDFICDDINRDGINDIIPLHVNWNYGIWELLPYLQQTNGSFIIDRSFIEMSTNLPMPQSAEKLIYGDFNGDGQKDILFIEGNDGNQLKNKLVFIRTGNRFVAQPVFQYDPFAKSLIK